MNPDNDISYNDIIIRKYRASDRIAVEDIQLKTYFLGKTIIPYVKNTKTINDEIRYFLEIEPQSCYVAVSRGKVVGYLLGCLDDTNHNESIFSFLGKLLIKIIQLPFMDKLDRKWWSGKIQMVLYVIIGKADEAKFTTPKNAGHIHINLLAQARGKGVGTRLLKTFFKYAKSKGTKLIHADSWGTRLNPNKNFWIKNGFKQYSKVKTMMWKDYYPNEEIYMVCYLKKL